MADEWNWTSRLDRAFTQRIYLMECSKVYSGLDPRFKFKVMGASGSAYKIKINNERISCKCPDHTVRHSLCKHLLFILIRALNQSDSIIYDSYFTSSSFRTIPETLVGCNEFIRKRELGEFTSVFKPNNNTDTNIPKIIRKPYLDDSCPICCEDFSETTNEDTLWCKTSCGKSVHTNCFAMWHSTKGESVTCVHCRAKWDFSNL